MPEPKDSAGLNDVQFSVVREPAAPPYKKGARTRLTARAFLHIIKRIEKGWPVTESCRAENFTYRRFRQICCRWPAYQARYEKAEKQRAEWRREAMEALVLHHAKDNWCAAAWWLERAHPDRYSLKTVVRHDGSVDAQPIGAEIPAERLVEYGRLMLEMAQENAGKAPELPVVTEAAG